MEAKAGCAAVLSSRCAQAREAALLFGGSRPGSLTKSEAVEAISALGVAVRSSDADGAIGDETTPEQLAHIAQSMKAKQYTRDDLLKLVTVGCASPRPSHPAQDLNPNGSGTISRGTLTYILKTNHRLQDDQLEAFFNDLNLMEQSGMRDAKQLRPELAGNQAVGFGGVARDAVHHVDEARLLGGNGAEVPHVHAGAAAGVDLDDVVGLPDVGVDGARLRVVFHFVHVDEASPVEGDGHGARRGGGPLAEGPRQGQRHQLVAAGGHPDLLALHEGAPVGAADVVVRGQAEPDVVHRVGVGQLEGDVVVHQNNVVRVGQHHHVEPQRARLDHQRRSLGEVVVGQVYAPEGLSGGLPKLPQEAGCVQPGGL
ncbi:calmodulin, putative [Babesia caballi]|uniref:Calmodulin, putative n=1 Tax=Babesia caballi TaxID=5871 RepID=A0AAV4M2T7_BABCB|nr:calmodulin, putative [Babesia caballi]